MSEEELHNRPGESYSQSVLAMMREVHQIDSRVSNIDTRVSLLEQSSAYTAKALDDIRGEAKSTNAVVREVRDSVVGWRGSLAIIAGGISLLAAIVIPLMIWALDRLYDKAPGLQ